MILAKLPTNESKNDWRNAAPTLLYRNLLRIVRVMRNSEPLYACSRRFVSSKVHSLQYMQ